MNLSKLEFESSNHICHISLELRKLMDKVIISIRIGWP